MKAEVQLIIEIANSNEYLNKKRSDIQEIINDLLKSDRESMIRAIEELTKIIPTTDLYLDGDGKGTTFDKESWQVVGFNQAIDEVLTIIGGRDEDKH